MGIDADALARRMVPEPWDLFLRRQFPAVAKKLGVELAELEEALELIKHLETQPGRKFTNERATTSSPTSSSAGWATSTSSCSTKTACPSCASTALPPDAADHAQRGAADEAQQFIKDKIRSAVWLIKCLDQRQRTIYKVAESIVSQQREFLDQGIDYLRPLVLRDVAEDIGMHESTVSRVVSNKYMHTPRGLFPMKFFFHSGIDRDYGDDISCLTVKSKIQQLIEAEDPKPRCPTARS